MAPGENLFSSTTMRPMPVLAQSQNGISMAPSEDGIDPIVVTAQRMASDSVIASDTLTMAGTLTPFADVYGEGLKIGSNSAFYRSAFRGSGSVKVFSASKIAQLGGIYLFLAAEAFDAQSLAAGDIEEDEFYSNMALGGVSLISAPAAIGAIPAVTLNVFYPGGLPAYTQNMYEQNQVLSQYFPTIWYLTPRY